MRFTTQIGNIRYEWDDGQATSLAIRLEFDGHQPNHFGVPAATAQPIEMGTFVGDTRRGGSCNVDTVQLIPHCNGTHTECAGHIVDQAVIVGDCLQIYWFPVALLTVQPAPASETQEVYRPPLQPSDRIITAAQLEGVWQQLDLGATDGLLIRTLPNPSDKRHWHYGPDREPPFFTVQATEWINQRGVHHLLVDFPSVDRMYDDGKLTNHHLYWNVEEDSHQLTDQVWTHKTVTEMVYVPSELADGLYMLNLQVPDLALDAVPSRPVIYPLTKLQTP